MLLWKGVGVLQHIIILGGLHEIAAAVSGDVTAPNLDVIFTEHVGLFKPGREAGGEGGCGFLEGVSGHGLPSGPGNGGALVAVPNKVADDDGCDASLNILHTNVVVTQGVTSIRHHPVEWGNDS